MGQRQRPSGWGSYREAMGYMKDNQGVHDHVLLKPHLARRMARADQGATVAQLLNSSHCNHSHECAVSELLSNQNLRYSAVNMAASSAASPRTLDGQPGATHLPRPRVCRHSKRDTGLGREVSQLVRWWTVLYRWVEATCRCG